MQVMLLDSESPGPYRIGIAGEILPITNIPYSSTRTAEGHFQGLSEQWCFGHHFEQVGTDKCWREVDVPAMIAELKRGKREKRPILLGMFGSKISLWIGERKEKIWLDDAQAEEIISKGKLLMTN